MKVSDFVAAKSTRIALLGSVIVGVVSAVIGVLIDNRVLLVTAMGFVGLINLVLAKAVLEAVSTARKVPGLGRSVS